MSGDVVYHFTCSDHGQPGITRSGVVIPNWHPYINASLAWFTSEAEPDREASGLGQNITRCDRMAFRFVVASNLVEPWTESPWRRGLRSWTLHDLERYGDPEHWFVASVPVPALPDLTYRAADRQERDQ